MVSLQHVCLTILYCDARGDGTTIRSNKRMLLLEQPEDGDHNIFKMWTNYEREVGICVDFREGSRLSADEKV
jgi:hypothetical protein